MYYEYYWEELPEDEKNRWPSPGTVMKFINSGGYPFELDKAQEKFSVLREYIVENVFVENWKSSYKFKGIDGWWNTVMFREKE
jgi:hypothetical protein